MNRRRTLADLISYSSITCTFECNIYRVAKFRASCPFVVYGLTEPRCIEHPRPEARSRPQSGRACTTFKGQSRSYGQSRERKICSVPGSARQNCSSAQSRRCRTVRQKIILDQLGAALSRINTEFLRTIFLVGRNEP